MGRTGAGEHGTVGREVQRYSDWELSTGFLCPPPFYVFPCSGCAATNHSHHSGANDAVYAQAMETALLFGQLRSSNVYLNQPDNYCELLVVSAPLCSCVSWGSLRMQSFKVASALALVRHVQLGRRRSFDFFFIASSTTISCDWQAIMKINSASRAGLT